MSSKKFIDAINEAITYCMSKDKNVICYGLGVTDPKGVFGSTINLEKKFGSKRVFDVPTSENALTGIAIGASLGGLKPLFIHQRLDFFLLAMDQLVNNASKWYYMFGSQISVPITIRLIIGRGWGQGPTHSQNLQSWFAHIPGLKVVMPSNPSDAKSLLISSIQDPNPVIFLEHRWLHNSHAKSKNIKKIKIGKAKKINNGKDITIIAMSYMVLEAIIAINELKKVNISCDLIDLVTVKPIDWQLINKSIKKTKRVMVIDTGFSFASIASEIISHLSINNFKDLKSSPIKIAMPDIPEPTSFSLTKNFYNDSNIIIKKVLKILNREKLINKINLLKNNKPHDVPGDWFKGPF